MLGPMRVERDSVRVHLPRRKVESLLAYLVLHPEQHTRDHLATLFWGDSSDTQARHSLRTALATVRQEISPELLLADRNHVQLNGETPLWVDLYQLLNLERDFDHTPSDLLQARLALWQGDLLAGFYDDWLAAEREHYRTRLLKLFLHVTQTLRARSEYAMAIDMARRVLDFDPANEQAHQHLMFCYVASGDRAAALRQYELCERALLDDLDAPPMPETTALYQWIKQNDSAEPSTAGRVTNLPIPLTSFIGRTRETAEVKRLLSPSPSDSASHTRLLTLIGAGGNGKTRLAIQTATDLIDRFEHGVWWVELAALHDGALVTQVVAKALGMNNLLGQPVSHTVANFIGDRHLLLVLDNCEHVIEACAQLAADLLGSCPNLHILTTSREPLNIGGETLWPVSTFAAPDPAHLTLLDLLLQFESLRLFVERAAAVQPGFALTLDNAQAVAEICRRLDGIPLAIELAAARVKVLSVDQISAYLASALGARFSLLTQGSRAAMPRHQTLRATIDWSYDLLDEDERGLFRRLAIFQGGFTLEVLEDLVQMASVPQPIFPTVLDRLSQLVDKSLVMVEMQGGHTRYRMLETLREYALEQFSDPGELLELQRQHAEAFFRLALRADPELSGPQQQTWLNRLEVEHANLRAALDCLIAGGDGERALRLATTLQRYWDYRGYAGEGREWFNRALTLRDQAAMETTAAALNAAGWLAYRQGELSVAQRHFEEALSLFEQTEDDLGIAHALRQLGLVEMDHGHYGSAQQHLETSLSLYRTHQHDIGIALTLSYLGGVAWDQDRYADARDLNSESLAIYQRLGHHLNCAFQALAVGDAERMLGNVITARAHYETGLEIAQNLQHRGLIGALYKSLGMLAFKQEDYAQARHYGEEALHIFREVGDKIHTGFALSSLGDVARKLGDTGQALAHYCQSLQIMVEVGYKWPTFDALEDITYLLTDAAQHPETAVRFLGAADVLRRETGIVVTPNQQARYDQVASSLRLQLGDTSFESLRQAGQNAPLAELVTEAARLSLA